jgi:hypothetical protein
MVSVLGPLEFLRKEIEEIARAYSKNLEVIISDHSSIKNIKQNYFYQRKQENMQLKKEK